MADDGLAIQPETETHAYGHIVWCSRPGWVRQMGDGSIELCSTEPMATWYIRQKGYGPTAKARTVATPEAPTQREPDLIAWDWRGQPDLAELARIVAERSGGAVHITPVEDTGDDQYAIIVADRPYTQTEATDWYANAWLRQQEGTP